MTRGTVNTFARLAPSRKILWYSSSIVSPPAVPTPTTQPVRCPTCSSNSPDCARACWAATIASTLKRSSIGNRRASSMWRGSGAGIAPTTETLKSDGVAWTSLPSPQLPSCRADQNAPTEWPSAETQPVPVTTIGSRSTAASVKTERAAKLNKVRDGFVGVPGLNRIHRYGHVILVFNRHNDLDQIE